MATITAGGLASGLDAGAVVREPVLIGSQQITLLQKQQSGVEAQVSALGELASELPAQQVAARTLGDTGAALDLGGIRDTAPPPRAPAARPPRLSRSRRESKNALKGEEKGRP